MIPGSLARRYARALIALADTQAKRDRFADDIGSFAELVGQRDADNIALIATLEADRYPLSQRRKLLDTLAARLRTDAMVIKFLNHVLERGRMSGVAQIARATRKMADDAAGRVRAQVTSARPLDPSDQAKLKTSLERATGKQVVMEVEVDPELIGGLVTKVGSFVLDGSLRASLTDLRTTLSGT